MEAVAVLATDWCYYETEADAEYDFESISGVIIGTIVDEDEEKIVLAHQFFPDWNQVRHVTVITKSSIVKRLDLDLSSLLEEGPEEISMDIEFKCDCCGEETPHAEGELLEDVGFVCNFCLEIEDQDDDSDPLELSDTTKALLCDCPGKCEVCNCG